MSGIGNWHPPPKRRKVATFRKERPNGEQCLKIDKHGQRCQRVEYSRGRCHSCYTATLRMIRLGRTSWEYLESIGEAKPARTKFEGGGQEREAKESEPERRSRLALKYQTFRGLGWTAEDRKKEEQERKTRK